MTDNQMSIKINTKVQDRSQIQIQDNESCHKQNKSHTNGMKEKSKERTFGERGSST